MALGRGIRRFRNNNVSQPNRIGYIANTPIISYEIRDISDPRHVIVVSNNHDSGFRSGNLPAPLSLRHSFAFQVIPGYVYKIVKML